MAKKTLTFVLFPKTDGTGPLPEGTLTEKDLTKIIPNGVKVHAEWHNYSGGLDASFILKNEGQPDQKREFGPGTGSNGNFKKEGSCVYSNISKSELKYDPPIQFTLTWEE